ncbi:MAG: glycoside hydrolase family 127 protein [Tannerella sp.]|nr:glycoside hydrolase family 127 protein [Tannerella sp.]
MTICLLACTDTNTAISDETLTPVPFHEVTLNDAFWLPRLKTQKETLVPFALDKTLPAVENLRKTGNYLKGIHDELPFPHRYVASDLYKVMEGAACLLKLERDPELEQRMDQIIDYIADAQQEDGYLYESHITGVSHNASHWGGGGMGDKPYSWVVHSHELYNMGHMYEGAIAYYQATGKDKWLKVAEKSARHINHVFFEGDPNYNDGKPVNQAPGHEEIELALVKLYRVTHDTLYLNMAKRFIDIRGVTYRPEGEGVMAPEYAQQHLPVREQTEAVGHAVRATYLYSGMADVSALTGDTTLRPALDSIWHNMVDTKMHITGGLGAIRGIEGFGPEYVLPNKEAYLETCAAVGNVFFNHRMYLMEKNGKYMDVAEIALFNNVLAGVNLEGNRFFYVNPLESDGQTPFNQGQPGRAPWFETACCPSNLARLIPQVSGMMYAYTSDEIYCSFYAGSNVKIPLKDGAVNLTQKTGYPYGENINFTINPITKNHEFTLRLRIPAWTGLQIVPGNLYHYIDDNKAAWEVKLNGQKVHATVKDGFVSIRKKWKAGDQVTLHLPMPLHFTKAIEQIEADRDRVCITRGPLVYCAEAVDNAFPVREAFIDKLPDTYSIDPARGGIMDGIDFVTIPAKVVGDSGSIENVPLKLVPYYAWDNRSHNAMTVWISQRAMEVSK